MRKARLVVGVLISLLLLFWVLRSVDLGKVAEAFRSATYVFLLPAALVLFGSFWLKAWRWRYLFQERGLGFWPLFSGVMIGYFGNFVLPANAGELVRTYVFGERVDMRKSAILATIVVEKVLDFLTLTLFMLPVILAHPSPGWMGRLGAIIGLSVGALWVFILVLPYQHRRVIGITATLLGRISVPMSQKVVHRLGIFLEGLEVLRHPSQMVKAFLLSIAVWGVVVVAWYLTGRSLGLALPLYAYALPMALTFMSMSIPALPGNLGAFEFLVVACLGFFKVDSSNALALAVLVRGIRLLPLAVGYIFLTREGLRLTELPLERGPLS